MSDKISFEGRVAVITGAGNGLGKDYALEIGRRGGKVVVNDLGGSGAGTGASRSSADEVVDQIRSEGGEAVANYDSVATRTGGEAIIKAGLDAFGRIDVCIANAGFLRDNRFEDLTDEQIDPIIDVHLKGAFNVAQPAYRAMRKNGYGRFILTGSASGMYGQPWQANYAAAKGGLMGLMHSIAVEGQQHGIFANLLLPVAQTRLAQEVKDGPQEVEQFAKAVSEADFSGVTGRMTTEFITPLTLYLASEACTETHSIFSANAGRYARVYIDVAEGWVAPPCETPCTPEDIAANLPQILDRTTLYQFKSVYQEFSAVSAAMRRQYPA